MANLLRFILTLSVCFTTTSSIFAQSSVEIENSNLKKTIATLKEQRTSLIGTVNKMDAIINDLNKKLAKNDSGSETIKLLKEDIAKLEGSINNWKSLYYAELQKVKNLEKIRTKLRNDNDELNRDNARLRNEIVSFENRIIELDNIVQILKNTIQNLEEVNYYLGKHVVALQIDSILKQEKINRQDVKIQDLEYDKLRLIKQRTALIDLTNKQNNYNNELKEKHKIDKLHLLSSYLGINYNLTSFNNPIISLSGEKFERGHYSNLSFSLYNSLVGGYFSVPYNYCSMNPFAKCPDDNIDVSYTIRDIETVVMALDIRGVDYNNLEYSNTENFFKTYTAGFHFTPMRFIYISLGTSIVKGSSWDLYEGDLSGYQSIVTDNSIVPIKNNDGYYVLNYERYSIIKPSFGVSYVVPFRGFAKGKTTNAKFNSKTLNNYNYRTGFQVEVGYDWLFDDFYAKAGLHIRLWNYNDNILDKSQEGNNVNRFRKAVDIILDADKKNNKNYNRELVRGVNIIYDILKIESESLYSMADELIRNQKFDEAEELKKKAEGLKSFYICLQLKILDKDNVNQSINEGIGDEMNCNYDFDVLNDFLPNDGSDDQANNRKLKIIFDELLQ